MLFYFPFIACADCGNITIPPVWSDSIKHMCCGSILRFGFFMIHLMCAIMLCVNKKSPDAETLSNGVNIFKRPSAPGFRIIGICPCGCSAIRFRYNTQKRKAISDKNVSEIHVKICGWSNFNTPKNSSGACRINQHKSDKSAFHNNNIYNQLPKVNQ
jgi:hypothetical protein